VERRHDEEQAAAARMTTATATMTHRGQASATGNATEGISDTEGGYRRRARQATATQEGSSNTRRAGGSDTQRAGNATHRARVTRHMERGQQRHTEGG
jgi:hypothetical protein